MLIFLSTTSTEKRLNEFEFWPSFFSNQVEKRNIVDQSMNSTSKSF